MPHLCEGNPLQGYQRLGERIPNTGQLSADPVVGTQSVKLFAFGKKESSDGFGRTSIYRVWEGLLNVVWPLGCTSPIAIPSN